MSDTILDEIVSAVRHRLDTTPEIPGLEDSAFKAAVIRRAEGLRSLRSALAGSEPAVIAECKKASPSAGVIRADFDPVALALAYADAGAAAISVVTEPDFFQGDSRWLAEVRGAVDLPVLRKDFIVSRRQLLETCVSGADAVLLIQRLLDRGTLAELLAVADELDLEVLLEVFADEDPAMAVESGAVLLGVNARDLATFEMRLDRVEEMVDEMPSDRIRVAESGIHDSETIGRLHEAGYDAFLVGEHLVRADDPGEALQRLLGS